MLIKVKGIRIRIQRVGGIFGEKIKLYLVQRKIRKNKLNKNKGVKENLRLTENKSRIIRNRY